MPPITKVMLTCFVSNVRAMGFYHRQGFEVDEISPVARTLRGKAYEPDYAILSKTIRVSQDSSSASGSVASDG